MLYVLLFASGVVAGRSWDALKAALTPLAGDASARFDALYASTARSLARAAEDVEDRWAERAHRDSQVMN
jgi:hypothetical protein